MLFGGPKSSLPDLGRFAGWLHGKRGTMLLYYLCGKMYRLRPKMSHFLICVVLGPDTLYESEVDLFMVCLGQS